MSNRKDHATRHSRSKGRGRASPPPAEPGVIAELDITPREFAIIAGALMAVSAVDILLAPAVGHTHTTEAEVSRLWGKLLTACRLIDIQDDQMAEQLWFARRET